MRPKNHGRNFHNSRRAFLSNTLQAAAVLSAGASGLLSTRAFADVARPRRHLINIHGGMRGGWDSYWFHSSFRKSDLDAIVAKDPTKCAISSSPFALPDAQQSLPVRFSERFPETAAGGGRLYAAKNQTNHWLGPGMSAFTAADLSQMVIWKGITKDADHTFSNILQLHGQISAYALSFSSLVADGISSQGYRCPLQFVEVMASPLVNTAMATGLQVPTCIDSIGTFQALTAPSANESANLSLRKMLNDTVTQLATTLSSSRFKLNSGKALYSSFAGSFNSYLNIGGSNLAQSTELKCLRKWYAVKIAQEMHAMLSSGTELALRVKAQCATAYADDLARALTAVTDNTDRLKAYLQKKNQLQKANPLLTAAQLEALPDLAPLTAEITPSLGDIDAVAVNAIFANVLLWSFRFAFSDFLIRNELSAVVDLMIPVTDSHTGDANQLVELAFDYSAFRQMMQSLRDFELPDGSGRNLLDVTTMVMTTDFDREPSLYADNPSLANVSPGTNHGNSVSVVMAGGLVNGGTVVGDLRTGLHSEAQYGSFFGGANPYNYPLPIDPMTGVASPGGIKVSSGCIFQTMLGIYNVPIPPQLLTSASSIAAVIKR